MNNYYYASIDTPPPPDKPSFNNYLEYISYLDTLLIFLAFCFYFVRKYLSNENTPNIIELIRLNQSKDKGISSILNDLRSACKADRVVVGLFHNTSVYGFNYHMLKMSVFHESLCDESQSLKKSVKDIPLSYISDELLLYEQNNNRLMFHISDPTIKYKCGQHLNRINVGTIINYLLVYNDTPIGILSFQYTFDQSSNFNSINSFEAILNSNVYKSIDYYLDNITSLIVK